MVEDELYFTKRIASMGSKTRIIRIPTSEKDFEVGDVCKVVLIRKKEVENTEESE